MYSFIRKGGYGVPATGYPTRSPAIGLFRRAV